MLATRIASRMGLPTAPVGIVEVSEALIAFTPELCVELPRSRVPCSPGLQFASRYPGDPHRVTLFDFMPDELLPNVSNLHDFAGMLALDKFLCNTNGRQALFQPVAEDAPTTGAEARSYKALMIDQGFCFNAGEWNFPDAPLRGLYARNRVYEGVIGWNSFEPWIERIKKFDERMLDEYISEIPPEWYADDLDTLLRLMEQLLRRRALVADLIFAAKNTTRHPFPNWI